MAIFNNNVCLTDQKDSPLPIAMAQCGARGSPSVIKFYNPYNFPAAFVYSIT